MTNRAAYMREYKERNREALKVYKRIWTRNKRHGIANGARTHGGNDKYIDLCKAEVDWLKDASLCDICNQKHPPHKSDLI